MRYHSLVVLATFLLIWNLVNSQVEWYPCEEEFAACIQNLWVTTKGFAIEVHTSQDCTSKSDESIRWSFLTLNEVEPNHDNCLLEFNGTKEFELRNVDFECSTYLTNDNTTLVHILRELESDIAVEVLLNFDGTIKESINEQNDCFESGSYNRTIELIEETMSLDLKVSGWTLDAVSNNLVIGTEIQLLLGDPKVEAAKTDIEILNSGSFGLNNITLISKDWNTHFNIPNWFHITNSEVESVGILELKINELRCDGNISTSSCFAKENSTINFFFGLNTLGLESLSNSFSLSNIVIKVQKDWPPTRSEIVRANVGAAVVIFILLSVILSSVFLKKFKRARKKYWNYDENLFCYDVRGTVEPDWKTKD